MKKYCKGCNKECSFLAACEILGRLYCLHCWDGMQLVPVNMIEEAVMRAPTDQKLLFDAVEALLIRIKKGNLDNS